MHPGWLGLIVAGGALGTSVRAWLEAAYAPSAGSWPWVTFWINVGGSLALGALLEGVAASGPDVGWRRGLRLGLGTGVLGGFTTYSTFSVETVELLRAGLWLVGLGYAVASVVAGIVAAVAGVRLVRGLSAWSGRAGDRRVR